MWSIMHRPEKDLSGNRLSGVVGTGQWVECGEQSGEFKQKLRANETSCADFDACAREYSPANGIRACGTRKTLFSRRSVRSGVGPTNSRGFEPIRPLKNHFVLFLFLFACLFVCFLFVCLFFRLWEEHLNLSSKNILICVNFLFLWSLCVVSFHSFDKRDYKQTKTNKTKINNNKNKSWRQDRQ